MQGEALEILISEQRFSTYDRMFNGNRIKAIEYYQLNIKIAQSLYPLLLYTEVSLRNLIHRSCTAHFQTDQWFQFCEQEEQIKKIEQVKKKIEAISSVLSSDKIVAELTFGFWCSLLNKRNAKHFWKPLQRAFPHLEASVKREKMASTINHIRKLRNRIFHYEPICNDLNVLRLNYLNMINVLRWMNPELLTWIKSISAFESLYEAASIMRQYQSEADVSYQK